METDPLGDVVTGAGLASMRGTRQITTRKPGGMQVLNAYSSSSPTMIARVPAGLPDQHTHLPPSREPHLPVLRLSLSTYLHDVTPEEQPSPTRRRKGCNENDDHHQQQASQEKT